MDIKLNNVFLPFTKRLAKKNHSLIFSMLILLLFTKKAALKD